MESRTLNNAKHLDLAVKARLFRGLADTSRLAILEALRTRRLNVSELTQVTGLGQSNISNHLACLRDCGLVTAEARGRYTYYGLADDQVEQLLGLAEAVLHDVARGVALCSRYGEPAVAELER